MIKKRNFCLVETKSQLLNLASFLKKHFLWSNDHKNKIIDKVEKININQKIYGAVTINDKEEIIAGILIFHQGLINDGNIDYNVMNLSSFAVEESYRGKGIAPRFARDLVNILVSKRYIITSYTSSGSAYRIWKKYGLNPMGSFRKDAFFFNHIPQLFLGKHKLKKQNIKIHNYKFEKAVSGFEDYGNCQAFEFNLISKNVFVVGKKIKIKRKYFGITISMNIFNIFWSNDYYLLNKFWSDIVGKLFLKNKCLAVISHFPLQTVKDFDSTQSGDYLILSQGDIDFIPPIQSELCYNR